MTTFSLYVHIPFCAHKCPYCDFTTYAVPKPPEKEYVAAVKEEMRLAATSDTWKNKKLGTVFFGGGTPSFFSYQGLGEIVDCAKSVFDAELLNEVTIEANPEHCTVEYAEGLRASGVTRVSLGVQSLQDKNLVALGRNHSAQKAKDAVEALVKGKIVHRSLDLMYGTPHQTIVDLTQDIVIATALSVQHISMYGLTIEAGTPYFVSHKKGDLKLPSEDLNTEMYEAMVHELSAKGFTRYEVSNFAKNKSEESMHNKNYWSHGEYLGLGAGAHSFARTAAEPFGVHWSNDAQPTRYIERCKKQEPALAWNEVLTANQALAEAFFVGLRQVAGVSFDKLLPVYGGLDPREVYAQLFERLHKNGLAVVDEGHIRLTSKGLIILDSIATELFE